MTFPSQGWVAALRQQPQTSNQPAAWTEDQGWYDAWGDGQLTREPTEELYGIARWFAYVCMKALLKAPATYPESTQTKHV